jgi:hypothetical protein
MDATKAIPDIVRFFQTTCTFVLALAITEAFKQFVADRSNKPEERRFFHSDRLAALMSFLFLALPFYQRMNRYSLRPTET